jgi:hypothetical protein
MSSMNRLWIVSNYNQDPSAVISSLTAPYIIYNQGDRSYIPAQFQQTGSVISSRHTGHNISDYLEFIVNNYNNLPDSLGFAKGNLFPRHITKEAFLARQPLDGFVPLYYEAATFKPKFHRLLRFRFGSQQIAPGYYLEFTNNWYAKYRKPGKYYPRLHDLFDHFFRREPPRYTPFVPGACMIVPTYNIQRWPLDTYKQLYEAVSYDFFPVEAFHVERSMLYFFDFPRY